MQQQRPEEGGLLGTLSPGQKKLEGKCFYLDSVRSRSAALLVETISLLGGVIESFLHKDVSFVVTGSQEGLKEQSGVVTKAGAKQASEESQLLTKKRESACSSSAKQRPATPRPMGCGSRGKALLEKAIRNNERLKGSSVLANARSWGVKILPVDDVLLYLKQLTRESFSARHKRQEKSCQTKQYAARVVKAASLRSPYLKVEDCSRKYKPLHMQSMTFPTLCYLGRFSPFETLPRTEKVTEQGEAKTREKKKSLSSNQDKPQSPLTCNPSPWRPCKKELAYCECCHQPFTNQEEHLQSDQHRQFVLDSSNYSVLDQLVAEMRAGFNLSPSQQSEAALNSPPSPHQIQDANHCELEPLTDVETEEAMKTLLAADSSSKSHGHSLAVKPLSSRPDALPPGVQLRNPNPEIFPPNTGGQFPDSQPLSPSRAIPLLDALTLKHCSSSQIADTQQLLPCPDSPCQSPDPYSLPPVLSPQVFDHCHIMEPHSPYSEPPVLYPQVMLHSPNPEQYTREEDMEVISSETKVVETTPQPVPAVTVPISTLVLPPLGLNYAEEVQGSVKEVLVSRRCRSLPRLSVSAPNPKKRCRSASPEPNQSKRRRMSRQGHKSFLKSENYIMHVAEACSLFDMEACQIPNCSTADCIPQIYMQQDLHLGDNFSPQSATQVLPTFNLCTVENVGTNQQGHLTFLVPDVQNPTQLPNQIDTTLGHGCICGPGQASWPVSPKTGHHNPPLDFTNNKSDCILPSQDSHTSLSQSVSSVCIESALLPDLATLSTSSSDSDWDCELLSQLDTQAAPLPPTESRCGLDRELLQRPCTWMHDTSYESRLHTVLQPSTPTASLCGEEIESSAFSRTIMQIVEVQH
ncbi:uncharacterized protein dbf4b [Myripristis murdjan]|uniref:Uncharacterized LOC115378130 n=1 Tax=Myripristis murdjan TaxID=586833 RepID=A0A667ZL98_9TELE|nr:uncharacterized protein LOC115378130 [Myripristis murdjan]XP_029934149.1 uncharacterized protein LOC115378130 [Myripristis murdjan]